MKRVSTFSVVLTCSLLSPAASAEPPAVWGGFGHAHLGGQFGTFGSIESDLRRLDAVGPDFTLGGIGGQFGGGGYALLGGALMLGGKGMGWFVPASSPDTAEVQVQGGGGGFSIGYAALNRDYFLLYPYVGASGYGIDVAVTNTSGRDMTIGDHALPAGESQTYRSGFWAAEFGVGFQRLLFFGTGGFLVGGEAGLITTIAGGDWHLGDSEVHNTGLGKLGFSGGFVRLTLGGGGFIFEGDWQGDDRPVSAPALAD